MFKFNASKQNKHMIHVIVLSLIVLGFIIATLLLTGFISNASKQVTNASVEGGYYADCINPGFMYGGQMYMMATMPDVNTERTSLPSDAEQVGRLKKSNEYPLAKDLTTYKASLDGSVLWRVQSQPNWIYIKMNDKYQLFTPLLLQLRWLRHDGKLYLCATDRDFATETNQLRWSSYFSPDKPTNEYFPKDAILLGKTNFTENYKYPSKELGISWSMYSDKDVYADPNNLEVLYLLYPNGVHPSINDGVRVDLFFLCE